MKKLAMLFVVALLALSVVSATTTTLSDAEVGMDYYDVQVVEFCLNNAGGQQNIAVVVDPICKDVDGNYGCQPADASAAGLFSVTPSASTMDDGDCVNLTLQTTIADPEDAGKFFYTVNGQVGETTIGSETGTVFVPEFGIIAALGILTIAGVYIYKKRN